jgi:hypothetical protein
MWMARRQQIDHAARRRAGALHQVRSDACRYLIAFGVEVAAHRAGGGETRKL